MNCSDCKNAGRCLRRDVEITEGQMRACSVSTSASNNWDVKYGVVDESVIPSSASRATPSITTKIKTVTKAATKFVASGLKILPKEISNERLAICKGCSFLGKHNICSSCGCFVPAKVKLPHEECPEGLWGVVLDRQSQNESESED